jgi:CHAT domain-containing protein
MKFSGRVAAALATAVVLGAVATGCGAGPAPSAGGADVTAAEEGLEFYWRSEYDSAAATWTSALGDARRNGDSLSVAHLLTWLGLAAYRTGDFDIARVHGEAALALKQGMPGPVDVARSWNALGMLALAEDRLAEAAVLLDSAGVAAVRDDDARAAGAAAGNRGLIHAYLGELEAGARLFGEMRTAAAAVGDRRLEGNALNNLAMISIWAGTPTEALMLVDSALAIYRQVSYPAGEQNALAQRATALAAMGDYPGSMAALDSAIVLARRHRMRGEEAELLRLQAMRFHELGDARRALRLLEEASVASREQVTPWELGGILHLRATIRLEQGQPELALAAIEAALAAHSQAEQPWEELEDLLLLARVHSELQNPTAARQAVDRALDIGHRLGGGWPLAMAELASAELDLRRGDGRRALEAVGRARTGAPAAHFRLQAETHVLAARGWTGLGELDRAAAEWRSAVHLLEGVRSAVSTPAELRLVASRSGSDVYGEAAATLLQLGLEEQALATADRSRGRAALRHPGGGRAAPDAGGELLLRRMDVLLGQLRELESIPSVERTAGTVGRQSLITMRLDALRDQYEDARHRQQLQPGQPTVSAVEEFNAERLRLALADDEALLHYTLRPDTLILLVVRREGMHALTVPARAADIASRVRLLRGLWGVADNPLRGLPAAQRLREVLIAPAESAGVLTGVRRLIVVPHGILEHVPFAALHDARSLRYLVQDYVITVAPSAAVVAAARRGGGAPPPAQLRAFAPFPDRLRATAGEAAAAARALPGGRSLVGSRATERAVRDALGTDAVVHIATHGVVNHRNPLFSRLELARGRGVASTDDGRLEVHEVLAMSVRSPLVILSGCETAAGDDWIRDPAQPAGFTTLALAFLHAGARMVAATLWRIDDVATARLASHFYESGSPGDPALALAEAQRAFIASSDFSSPYYWAAFVAVGDGAASAHHPRSGRAGR